MTKSTINTLCTSSGRASIGYRMGTCFLSISRIITSVFVMGLKVLGSGYVSGMLVVFIRLVSK